MATTHFYRYAGWSAYVSAAATIMTFITAIIFFTVGGSFGKINDISSVLQLLFMLPLPLALYRLFRHNAQTLNLLAALGIAGMLVGVVGQSLLVFDVITYQQSLAFFPGAAAIGIWLLLTDYLALASGLFPRGLAWAGFIAGAGYLVTVAGFLLGGQQNLFFYIGGFVLVISYPVWAIWLGRLLLSLGMR
jgi:hypothetical protein